MLDNMSVATLKTGDVLKITFYAHRCMHLIRDERNIPSSNVASCTAVWRLSSELDFFKPNVGPTSAELLLSVYNKECELEM